MTTSKKEETLVPNDVFDVLRALVNKLEGLAAYEKYKADGKPEVWDEMKRHDEAAVKTLAKQLEELVQGGRLKLA